MDSILSFRGNSAQRMKIGLGLLLLVVATQTAGSIALARTGRPTEPCKAASTTGRTSASLTSLCHVS